MTKNTILTLGFLASIFYANCQSTKTIYFDDNWRKTDKNNASFYREITKQATKLYLIQDFYLNGQIQMNGAYHDKKGIAETGTFTYYDSTGAIEQITNYENGERNGSHAYFYPNGVTSEKVSYSDGQEVGEYSEFYESGALRASANYVNGDLVGELSRFYGDGTKLMSIKLDQSETGKCEIYFEDGSLLEEGNFIEGLRDGVWYRYNRAGEVLDSTIYKELEKRDQFMKDQNRGDSGSNHPRFTVKYSKSVDKVFLADRYILSDDGDSGITYFPEVEAMFPGGAKEMRKYISENVVYPMKARKKNVQSKVYVSFIVEPNGSISAITILEGHRFFHSEVIRLIESMPKWIPGEVNGKAVRARCRLPITFSLN